MYVVTAYVEWGEEWWIVGVYSKASLAMLAAQNVAANIEATTRRNRGHYWDVDAKLVELDSVPT